MKDFWNCLSFQNQLKEKLSKLIDAKEKQFPLENNVSG